MQGAEEKARELRSQLRTSEAAAAAARASAAQEQAAAAASALELAQKDKENEEKLERIVQEQKTEARSSLGAREGQSAGRVEEGGRTCRSGMRRQGWWRSVMSLRSMRDR